MRYICCVSMCSADRRCQRQCCLSLWRYLSVLLVVMNTVSCLPTPYRRDPTAFLCSLKHSGSTCRHGSHIGIVSLMRCTAYEATAVVLYNFRCSAGFDGKQNEVGDGYVKCTQSRQILATEADPACVQNVESLTCSPSAEYCPSGVE